MFWLHSDKFDIFPKFPPNYLGVHRLTNHDTARTHQINVTHAMKGEACDRRLLLHWERAQIFVLCDQHCCIDRFYASCFQPCGCASRSPTRPTRQGNGGIWHIARRDGQSMRRLIIRKVFVLFLAINAYDLNCCLRCVCQGALKI